MPQFDALPDEIAATLEKGGRQTIDLEPYNQALSTAEQGKWYTVRPDGPSGETFDMIRRRVGQAKRKLSLNVQTKKGENDALYFKVLGASSDNGNGNQAPRASRRSQAAEPEPVPAAAD